jgi:CheY-like chemotaxis protein
MADSPRRNRVLVIDDDAAVRQTFRRLIDHAGFDVVVAGDGAEGLQMLRDDPTIGLVLLDYDMPGLNGAGVRAVQRADPQLWSVPTVIVSGTQESDALRDELQPTEYLRKPVSRKRLIATVARYCAPRSASENS